MLIPYRNSLLQGTLKSDAQYIICSFYDNFYKYYVYFPDISFEFLYKFLIKYDLNKQYPERLASDIFTLTIEYENIEESIINATNTLDFKCLAYTMPNNITKKFTSKYRLFLRNKSIFLVNTKGFNSFFNLINFKKQEDKKIFKNYVVQQYMNRYCNSSND